MSTILLEDVAKAFGSHHAARGISLTVASGKFAVVVGPSGCGKTTLLRLVAGLEQPDRGRILIDERDVTARRPGQRELGMVFQSYALFPHLTVAENLLFGLKLRRTPRGERRKKLERTSRLLGLEALLSRRPSEISGGQQQRVALGRAIIGGRRTVLMDEPLSNLDAKLRQQMRLELKALARDLGMTVLYVTHDQAEALGMGDTVVVMNDGRIEQAAAPETLYEQPQSVFVARFIGTPPMNLLPLENSDGRTRIEGTGQPLPVAAAHAGHVLGMRPEQLTPCGRDAPGLDTVVETVEYQGADAVLTCRLGPHALVARLPGRTRLRPGETLRLGWPGDAVHLFDARSGKRADIRPPAACDHTHHAKGAIYATP